jgi:hypothetical protein
MNEMSYVVASARESQPTRQGKARQLGLGLGLATMQGKARQGNSSIVRQSPQQASAACVCVDALPHWSTYLVSGIDIPFSTQQTLVVWWPTSTTHAVSVPEP